MTKSERRDEAQLEIDEMRERIAVLEEEHGLQVDEDPKWTKRAEKWACGFLISTVAFWVLAIGLSCLAVAEVVPAAVPAHLGASGDSVAFLTAMLTALALLAGVRTMRLQTRELAEARRDRWRAHQEAHAHREATDRLAETNAAAVRIELMRVRRSAFEAVVAAFTEALKQNGDKRFMTGHVNSATLRARQEIGVRSSGVSPRERAEAITHKLKQDYTRFQSIESYGTVDASLQSLVEAEHLAQLISLPDTQHKVEPAV